MKRKELLSKKLVIIALIAIVLSFFSIFLAITRLDITGASSGEGYVNITVLSVVDISIGTSSITFFATHPSSTRNSYNSSDVKGCDKDNYCGFNLTNDGSRFANITIQETESLFTSLNYDATKHFAYNVTMKDPLYTTAYGGSGDCSTGYSSGLKGPDDDGQTGQWRAIPSSSAEVAICYLNYTDESPDGNPEHRPDIAEVEINITVPSDEATGSRTGTLTFTASDASP